MAHSTSFLAFLHWCKKATTWISASPAARGRGVIKFWPRQHTWRLLVKGIPSGGKKANTFLEESLCSSLSGARIQGLKVKPPSCDQEVKCHTCRWRLRSKEDIKILDPFLELMYWPPDCLSMDFLSKKKKELPFWTLLVRFLSIYSWRHSWYIWAHSDKF